MGKEILIDKVEEELKVASELGHEFRKTAENIVALISGEREHLDYNDTEKKYDWEVIA